ncbi:MAG TPA: exosome complex protein Rrp42 [archaeon]|nr:exosome complex protein Rrp42 [archaeon]
MEEKYALELIENGKRIDERGFKDFRKIEINRNVIPKAEGSAEVKFGDTHIIAGIKIELGEPFDDTPNEGVLSVSTEFTPMAAPEFESGPPGEDAIELSRVVDRGIRESKCIELEKLCITPGEKAWCVFIDIYVISHQGNLLDCAALAALSALLSARIPKLDGEKVIRTEYQGKLPVVFKPITITIGKVANRFILDPTFVEGNVLESKLTVCIRDDDNICALQKQGRMGLAIEEIEEMVDIAIEKSKEIRGLLK